MGRDREVRSSPASAEHTRDAHERVLRARSATSYLGARHVGAFEKLNEFLGERGSEIDSHTTLVEAFRGFRAAKNERERQRNDGSFLAARERLVGRIRSAKQGERLDNPEDAVPWEGKNLAQYQSHLNLLQSADTLTALEHQARAGDEEAQRLVAERATLLENQAVLERLFGPKGERDQRTGELQGASKFWEAFEQREQEAREAAERRIRNVVEQGGHRIEVTYEGRVHRGAILLRKVKRTKELRSERRGRKEEEARFRDIVSWVVDDVENVPGVKKGHGYTETFNNAPEYLRRALQDVARDIEARSREAEEVAAAE